MIEVKMVNEKMVNSNTHLQILNIHSPNGLKDSVSKHFWVVCVVTREQPDFSTSCQFLDWQICGWPDLDESLCKGHHPII